MKVQVHELRGTEDTVVGTIWWNGSEFVLEPQYPLLENILFRPVVDPNTGKKITSQQDPEAFLRALKFTYTSAYLRVTAPIEENEPTIPPIIKSDQGFEKPKVKPSPFRKSS